MSESFEGETEPKFLREVQAIEESGVRIKTRDDIARLVELPLREACEVLWDKNIETWQSSANKKDVAMGECYIIVGFDTLSPENQLIGSSLGKQYEYSGRKLLKISFPVERETSVTEIRDAAKARIEKFLPQKMTWGQRYTLKDLQKIYGDTQRKLTAEDFSDFYYDDAQNLFYPSEEIYRKVNASG
jgi:hypothetical protein